nr:MAG TPA: hypothetical protein [Caudoviricetes sp.]
MYVIMFFEIVSVLASLTGGDSYCQLMKRCL